MATLVERLSDDERFEGVLFADGYDEAFIGLGWRAPHSGPVAVYDVETTVGIIMRGGRSFEEALEHFESHVVGSYVGDRTPVFMVIVDGKKALDEGIYF
jgi:hypothetical protein